MQIYNQDTVSNDYDVIQSKHDIIKLLAEKRTSDILHAVASTTNSSHILVRKLRISNKIYYTHMAQLKKAGLVKKNNGKYFLSSFGKVCYDILINCQSQIDNALTDYFKLNAIDTMMSTMPKDELNIIIDALFEDEKIKQILLAIK